MCYSVYSLCVMMCICRILIKITYLLITFHQRTWIIVSHYSAVFFRVDVVFVFYYVIIDVVQFSRAVNKYINI